MIVRPLCLGFLVLSLAGCAYPTSSISQGTEAGHLRVISPAGADIIVDGQPRGTFSGDKPTIIDVAPGKHRVGLSVGGRPVLDRDYEIGAGSTVEIGG